MSDYNESDIDFRPYITSLLKNWYWIIGLGLLAGALAYFATGWLVAPSYEATALVTISDLRQRVAFDPRIVTEAEEQAPRVYTEIALSDAVLANLREQVPAVSSLTLQHIRSMVSASPGSDPSLIRLEARNTDPQLAADLANGLARELVAWANRSDGSIGLEQLRFFEQQLAEAQGEVDALSAALIDFQAGNRATLLENEFAVLQQTHADLLAKQKDVDSLLLDIDSVLSVAGAGSRGRPLTTDDQFTALILKLRAFGGSASGDSATLPWQLQINSGEATEANQADLVQQITELREALVIQAAQAESALAEIEPQLLAVQREREATNATQAQLRRDIDLAIETQTTLARTVEEKRITSADTNTNATVASLSAVPTSPTGPRQLFNALAAFTGVALLVTFFIILRTWWELSNSASVPQAPASTMHAGSDQVVEVDYRS